MTTPANPTPEKGQTPLSSAAWERIVHGDVPEHEQLVAMSDFAEELELSLASTKRRLAEVEAINKQACKDWADDDTAIKELARPFGIRDDDTPGYFKNSVQIVEELTRRLAEVEKERDVNVPKDHVIDRSASLEVQLRQAETWIENMHRSYLAIQQTCSKKDANLTALRNAADGLGGHIEAAITVLQSCGQMHQPEAAKTMVRILRKKRAAYAALISEGQPTSDGQSEGQRSRKSRAKAA